MIKKFFSKLSQDERGAGMAEYLIIIGLVGILGITGFTAFGGNVNTTVQGFGTTISALNTGTAPAN